MDGPISSNLDDFSLTKGGLFFNLMVRSGLIKTEFARPARRAIFLALFSWLPMLILSLLQGWFGGRSELPFLRDFTVHVRFLLCVPVLVIAEPILEGRTKAALKHLVSSGLILEKDYPVFESIVRRAIRLRDSLLAETIIVGVVMLGVIFLRIEYLGSASTWQGLVAETGRTRTPAGWWSCS